MQEQIIFANSKYPTEVSEVSNSKHNVKYIYIYTIILPWSCTDGRYFYHISGTALFSGTNFRFFGTIVIVLLHFGYTCSNQEIGFKWK